VTRSLPGGGDGGVGPTFVLGYFTQDTGDLASHDALVPRALLRWGNYDAASRTVRWQASEIPGDAQMPATRDLPASLYVRGKPAWFGSATWPPIGPDVAGHGTPNPAQRCYESHAAVGRLDAAACYGKASATS
jgi:hypothetical protein